MSTLLSRLAAARDAALGTAGSIVDRALVDVALHMSKRAPDREAVARDDHAGALAELARVTETYADPRYLSEPDAFFVPPAPVDVSLDPVRALPHGAGAVVDLSWPSAFVPVHPGARDAYLAHRENATGRARLWLHTSPRPAVVCVHGYLGGHLGFEETSFATGWLHGLGVDVAVALLPFHGSRCPKGRQGMFPGRDPWRTVEGFAHAVHDLRVLIRWLRARGAPSVTLFGMSLGAYTSALLSTVEAGVDHTVMMIPLASIADAYHEHREGRSDAPPAWLRARLDGAFRVVSPLSRRPLVAPENALVLAANGDRITRHNHAERLRDHFGAAMEVFPGGHILQAGRGRAFGEIARFLAKRGAIAPR